MPRLILMSAFGESELAENMVYFLEHLEQAEHSISDKELRYLENISVKDRGPVLYWLMNECAEVGYASPLSRPSASCPRPIVCLAARPWLSHVGI